MDKAEYGHELNVGDIIEVSEIIGQGTRYKVHRVTKKYAFVMWNEVGEGKFPRTYMPGFRYLPKDKWNNTTFTIYKQLQTT